MPRRAGVPKRDVLPDPKFNSKVVTKLINQVMYDGKKSTAEGIVYGAFDIVEKKLNQPAIDVFTKALENVMPAVEVKARRVGGSTYQVPLDIRADRRQTLGIRWMTLYARKRWTNVLQAKLWTLSTARAALSRRKKKPIVWQKPTKRLHIIAGNLYQPILIVKGSHENILIINRENNLNYAKRNCA